MGKKDGIINRSNECHGNREPDVVLASPSIHQDNTNMPQTNKTLQQREKELVANMKLEMANDPYMAYWAQIKDAEHRLSSRCKLESNSGGILPKVFRQSSKGSKKKKVEDDESMDAEPEKKKEKPDSDSDDVDFFASSDEDEKEKPKPKMVTPKPRAVTANPSKKKKTPEKEIVAPAPTEKAPIEKEEK